MTMMKMIHSKKDMGKKGSSGGMSVVPGDSPPGVCLKIPSYSNSPVVIVMVLMIARPGVAKGERENSMPGSKKAM